ncbi:MAG: hypothetical protein QW638_05955 [Candidatus Bathyarchaeia archaeon]
MTSPHTRFMAGRYFSSNLMNRGNGPIIPSPEGSGRGLKPRISLRGMNLAKPTLVLFSSSIQPIAEFRSSNTMALIQPFEEFIIALWYSGLKPIRSSRGPWYPGRAPASPISFTLSNPLSAAATFCHSSLFAENCVMVVSTSFASLPASTIIPLNLLCLSTCFSVSRSIS